MKITAGQPPCGTAPSGTVSVAASDVPSAEAIVTSWRLEASAGADASSAATVASRTSRAPLVKPDTAAKGSPRI